MRLKDTAIILGIIILDQITKVWVQMDFIDPHMPLEITSFFNLVLAYNHGISFSMLQAGSALQVGALTVMALVIVAILVTWLRRGPSSIVACALSLIIGGALGNVIDRIRIGAVVDFLDFHVGSWHWPAFNVADSAICIGVVLILLDNLMGEKHEN